MNRPPRNLRADWAKLDEPTRGAAYLLRPALDELPDPVARWLSRAIPRGARLLTTAELELHGDLRVRGWAPFSAVQRIHPSHGFVWAASARLSRVIPVSGADRFTRSSGEMSWRMGGLIPVVRASGADVTRSAAGRFAAELLVGVPAAALSPQVSWRPVDAEQAVAAVSAGGEVHEVTVRVSRAGTLDAVLLQRWGDPDGSTFDLHTFGADLSGHGSVGGFTVPLQITAGWHYDTARWPVGQFIRYTVDRAVYR